MALAGWVFDTALAWMTSFKTSAMLQRMPHHAGRQIAHTCPARTNSLVHRAHGTFQLKCFLIAQKFARDVGATIVLKYLLYVGATIV